MFLNFWCVVQCKKKKKNCNIHIIVRYCAMEKTGKYIYIYIYTWLWDVCVTAKGINIWKWFWVNSHVWVLSLLHPCKIVVGLFVDPCCFFMQEEEINLLVWVTNTIGFFCLELLPNLVSIFFWVISWCKTLSRNLSLIIHRRRLACSFLFVAIWALCVCVCAQRKRDTKSLRTSGGGGVHEFQVFLSKREILSGCSCWAFFFFVCVFVCAAKEKKKIP